MSWINVKKLILLKGSSLNLQDVLKKGVEYLTHLDFDDFAQNLDKVIPSFIFSSINLCTNLTHLSLPLQIFKGQIKVSSLSEKIAKNLKSLQIKDFGWNSRDADLLQLLEKASNLEELTLEMKHLKGLCLDNLTGNCKKLSIPKCKTIGNRNLEQVLKRLYNLEHLDISETEIKSETLASVSDQLISFGAGSALTFFSGGHYKKLSFSRLRILNLEGHEKVDDDVLCTFIKKCPLLEEVYLRFCKFTGDTFRRLAELKNLTHLDFSCTNVTNDCISYLAPKLENLKEVYCLSVTETTPFGLLPFVEFCPKLACLRIGDSKHFTSEFFGLSEKLVRRSSNLPLEIQLYHFYTIYCTAGLGVTWEMNRLQLKLIDPSTNRRNRCRIVQHRFWPVWRWENLPENPVWGVSF